ncbi:unnamed protein product [Brassica rapa]|uniref:Uncharacterized protein n=2 Tax=Brassica TaxID=3705 RepID=A0A8D9CKG7_BRACM|nr:unnamed protein product [Brassica napus]CAG7860155.1 unnamed protein product [Brassica rapa]
MQGQTLSDFFLIVLIFFFWFRVCGFDFVIVVLIVQGGVSCT